MTTPFRAYQPGPPDILLAAALFLAAGLASPAQGAVILTADTSRPSTSTFVRGESITLTFHAQRLLPAGKNLRLLLTFRNERGVALGSRAVGVIPDRKGEWQTSVQAPSSSLGYFRVDAALSNGVTLAALGTRPAGFLTYCVVPDPASRVDYGERDSHFGMQGGFSTAANVIPYLGLRWVLDGYNWRDNEPDYSGQFTEARNKALARGEKYPPPHPVAEHVRYHGRPWKTYTLPTLMASAPLAAVEKTTLATGNHSQGALTTTVTVPTEHGGAPAVSGEQAWVRYAGAAAGSYAANYPDRHQHLFQISWEPAIPWGFNGSPAQLVRIYQLAFTAMHAADPRALVVGPCLFPNTTDDNLAEMEGLWQAGLAHYLDGFSIHPYVAYPPEAHAMVNQVRTQLRMVKDAAGKLLPWYGTEHGYQSANDPNVVSELEQARGDIRQALVVLGEGAAIDVEFYIADWSRMDGMYGYYWNLNPKIPFGSDKIGPKLAAPALAALTYLLDGARSAGAMENLGGTTMGYKFVRAESVIRALWDYGCKRQLKLGVGTRSGPATLFDWMGNPHTVRIVNGVVSVPVGPDPVYLKVTAR
jgi:hypothetical protein